MVDINRKQTRSALQAWHQTSRLGELPLAGLLCVDQRREALGYDASAIGRALALRQLLRALLAELRPNEAEPDPADPSYILTVYGIGYRFNDELENPAA